MAETFDNVYNTMSKNKFKVTGLMDTSYSHHIWHTLYTLLFLINKIRHYIFHLSVDSFKNFLRDLIYFFSFCDLEYSIVPSLKRI